MNVAGMRHGRSKDVRFINMILLLSLATVLILPIYVLFFLTPAFSDFINRDTEKRLINVAERMALSLQGEDVISSRSITPEFLNSLEHIRSSIGLYKVKIFAVDGTIVYSTDPADIGNKSSKSFFRDIVATGHPHTDMVTKETSVGAGKKRIRKIVEAYVPIINGDEFNVVGVFEIYYDVTDTIDALEKLSLHAYVVMLSIVLVLLAAVLLSSYKAHIHLRKRESAEQEIRQQKQLLEQQNLELARMHEQAEKLSLLDPLTDLGNRRLLEILFERSFALAHRYDKELSLIMVDVDHFKSYNDEHGHQAGDLVLVSLALTITKQLRETDLAFRYGGEEFLLLLPEIGLKDCALVAEKLRRAIAEETVVTVSMGYTSYRPGTTMEEMVREADEALYRAKSQGRNSVVCAKTESV